MSWYSIIYTRVRRERELHPLLSKLGLYDLFLNTLVVAQFILLFISIFIYVDILLGYYVQSSMQASIYFCIYFTLIFLAVWSLLAIHFVDVARVPDEFKVDVETDLALRACTPVEGTKVVLEKSTQEQVQKQADILEKYCNRVGIIVAEIDQVGRIRYCYECKHVKPDRCRHCSSCGKCVLGSIVAYRRFLVTCLEGVVRYFVNQNWIAEAGKFTAIVLICIPFSVFGYYPLGELLKFHWDLVGLNETTCEQAKPAILRYDNMADYNMGRRANLRKVFGWGLWLTPLPTDIEDGIHFEICYFEESNEHRFVRLEVENSETDS